MCPVLFAQRDGLTEYLRLVYVNTLMLQQILVEPGWFERMTPEDLRALSPLIYQHINPCGTFELDLAKRLLLAAA